MSIRVLVGAPCLARTQDRLLDCARLRTLGRLAGPLPGCRRSTAEVLVLLHRLAPAATIEKASIDEVYSECC